MLKYWPFKKIYLIVCGSLLLAAATYFLAVKNTLAAWEVNRQLNDQLTRGGDVSYDPGYLERKNRNLDRVLSRYRVDTSVFRNSMLSNIAVLAEANQVKLTEVPLPDAAYRTSEYLVQKLSFEGGFFDLNRFLYQAEHKDQLGVARAVEFRMVEKRTAAAGIKKLVMSVYLETALK